jgi:predicted nucleotidyltransferase
MRRQVEIEFDIRDLIPVIATQYPTVSAMYLFGSRKYRTGSLRSDIDILVKTSRHLRPGKMREVVTEISKALDLFIMLNGTAVSAVNGSSISAENDDALIERLDA